MAKKKQNVVYTHPVPSADRWNTPTLEQLLEPLKAHHRKALDTLLAAIADLDDVEQALVWYGPSWKWTLVLRHPAVDASNPDQICYIVPDPETPQVVVPMTDEMADSLPLKRLNRFIRDGIKVAKIAASIYWATWTPGTIAEAEHLADLIRRKRNWARGEAPTLDDA